ncbi:hypothetical protein D9M71_669440 [compost metagenome]
MAQGQLQDLLEATGTGVQVRAIVDGVLGIDVGAGFDQHLGRLYLVTVGGEQQRGAALFVAGLDVDALVEQVFYLCGIATLGSFAQLVFEHATFGVGRERSEHGQQHGEENVEVFQAHSAASVCCSMNGRMIEIESPI